MAEAINGGLVEKAKKELNEYPETRESIIEELKRRIIDKESMLIPPYVRRHT